MDDELEGSPSRNVGPTFRARGRRAPDDTVAFLFTDVEASTRRWEGEREAMSRDLARHDEILRRQVRTVGGTVFAHTGDGLAAVFPTASAAVTAAVAGQRALIEERWAAARKLRVRMAVHAGAAERRGGNYFGPAVNRAARIMGVAHGGQILCSGCAADLARDDVPASIGFIDLGEHSLAGLTRLERIFQLTAPGLPLAFLPLRAIGAQRHNLPLPLTPFIGRAAELENLRRLLQTSRLITLTGVGGGGKTRLALEVAAASLNEFADGIWLVELGPVGHPALVLGEVCAAVGVPSEALVTGSGQLEETLCAHLRARRLLILIDNSEHLVDECARVIHTLLARCAQVGVMVTSREVLGLPGEVVWRIPPLSLPPPTVSAMEDLAASDAVALFCERARAARPGFALSATNALSVAQICRRLDGIPLALELAAARVRALSTEQVAERLDDRFRLLTGGTRTAVARHQTLRAAMNWSFEALSPPEQVVFRRLAVFPAGFDLDAAEAVARLDDAEALGTRLRFDTLDLLSRLVDKSLVVAQADGIEGRYRLLETVRQFANERLAEAGETATAHRRHRDHFLHSAAWMGWPGDHDRLRRLQIDEDNFRAALDWSLAAAEEEAGLELAAAVWLHWLWDGRPEGVGWLERALSGSVRPSTPARVEALVGLGFLLLDVANHDRRRSEQLVREALDLAESIGDDSGRARALYFLGEVALRRGDPQRAERLHAEALASHQETNLTARGWSHYSLGNTAVVLGDLTTAAAHFEQALALARRQHSLLLTPQVLAALAPVAALSGHSERAVRLADEAVEVAARVPWRRVTVLVLVRASEAMLLAEHVSAARDRLRQLLGLVADVRSRWFLADALEIAALLLCRDDRPAAASRLIAVCEKVRDADGEPFGGTRGLSVVVRACRSRVRQALGVDRDEAERARGQQMSLEEAISYALVALDGGGARRTGAG